MIRWGGRFLPAAPATNVFRGEWLALALKAVLMPNSLGASLELSVETGDAPVSVVIDGGRVTAGVGASARAEMTVRGNVRLLLAVIAGAVSLDEAEERGLVVEGSTRSRRKLEKLVA